MDDFYGTEYYDPDELLGPPLLPNGTYKMRVTSIYDAQTSTGKKQYQIGLEVVEGEFQGTLHTDFLLKPFGETPAERRRTGWRLGQFLNALGVGRISSEELKRVAIGKVVLVTTQQDSYNGVTRTKISAYAPPRDTSAESSKLDF